MSKPTLTDLGYTHSQSATATSIKSAYKSNLMKLIKNDTFLPYSVYINDQDKYNQADGSPVIDLTGITVGRFGGWTTYGTNSLGAVAVVPGTNGFPAAVRNKHDAYVKVDVAPAFGVNNLFRWATLPTVDLEWVGTNLTYSNYAVAPPAEIGTNSYLSHKMTCSAAGPTTFSWDHATLLLNGNYTFSGYFKYTGSIDKIRLHRYNVTSAYTVEEVEFDINTGVMTVKKGSPQAYTMTDVGGGWWRCSMTPVTLDGAEPYKFGFYACEPSTGNLTWTAAGTETVGACHFQLETGTTMNRYKPNLVACVPYTEHNLYSASEGGFESRLSSALFWNYVGVDTGSAAFTYSILQEPPAAIPYTRPVLFTSKNTATTAEYVKRTLNPTRSHGADYRTYSLYVKQGTQRYVWIGDAQANTYGIFDIQLGTVTTMAASAIDAGIVDAGGGWYRIYCSWGPYEGTTAEMRWGFAQNGTTIGYVTGNPSFYFCAPQCTDGLGKASGLPDYIPTYFPRNPDPYQQYTRNPGKLKGVVNKGLHLERYAINYVYDNTTWTSTTLTNASKAASASGVHTKQVNAYDLDSDTTNAEHSIKKTETHALANTNHVFSVDVSMLRDIAATHLPAKYVALSIFRNAGVDLASRAVFDLQEGRVVSTSGTAHVTAGVSRTVPIEWLTLHTVCNSGASADLTWQINILSDTGDLVHNQARRIVMHGAALISGTSPMLGTMMTTGAGNHDRDNRRIAIPLPVIGRWTVVAKLYMEDDFTSGYTKEIVYLGSDHQVGTFSGIEISTVSGTDPTIRFFGYHSYPTVVWDKQTGYEFDSYTGTTMTIAVTSEVMPGGTGRIAFSINGGTVEKYTGVWPSGRNIDHTGYTESTYLSYGAWASAGTTAPHYFFLGGRGRGLDARVEEVYVYKGAVDDAILQTLST